LNRCEVGRRLKIKYLTLREESNIRQTFKDDLSAKISGRHHGSETPVILKSGGKVQRSILKEFKNHILEFSTPSNNYLKNKKTLRAKCGKCCYISPGKIIAGSIFPKFFF
jgi:hypothetical protein